MKENHFCKEYGEAEIKHIYIETYCKKNMILEIKEK